MEDRVNDETPGNEKTKSERLLLHLSNISFSPTDVVSVRWSETHPFLKKVILTRIRTCYELFTLSSDSPSYLDDVEKLALALERHKQEEK
jgi:hypothetical protein